MMVTIDISTIEHRFHQIINQLSVLWGTTLYGQWSSIDMDMGQNPVPLW